MSWCSATVDPSTGASVVWFGTARGEVVQLDAADGRVHAAPDGRTLALTLGDPKALHEDTAVVLFDVERGEVVARVALAEKNADGDEIGRFAPEGRSYLVKDARGHGRLKLLRAPDWRATPLPAFDDLRTTEPAWSLDGGALLIGIVGYEYGIERDFERTSARLAIVDVGKSEPTVRTLRIEPSTRAFAYPGPMAPDPDGRSVWVVVFEYDQDERSFGVPSSVVRLDLASGAVTRTPIENPCGLDDAVHAVVAPDGRTIVFVGEGLGETAAYDTETYEERWRFGFGGGGPFPMYGEIDASSSRFVNWCPAYERRAGLLATDGSGEGAAFGGRGFARLDVDDASATVVGTGREGVVSLALDDGTTRWCYDELDADTWLFASPECFVDATPAALGRAAVHHGPRRFALLDLADALLDPKRARASVAGVPVAAPSVARWRGAVADER